MKETIFEWQIVDGPIKNAVEKVVTDASYGSNIGDLKCSVRESAQDISMVFHRNLPNELYGFSTSKSILVDQQKSHSETLRLTEWLNGFFNKP